MFLVFFLENCPFCVDAVNALEKNNLEYIVYNVSRENKEKVKPLIIHTLIMANYCSDIARKKYIAGLEKNKQDFCQEAIAETTEKKIKITFPQIFVCNKTFANKIIDNVYEISNDVSYIGGCSDLLKKLQA